MSNVTKGINAEIVGNDVWTEPPLKPALEIGSVDIWLANLDLPPSQTQDSFLSHLSSDEIERAERFKFAPHRSRFITARGILRSLLGRYLRVDPADLDFDYNPHGKPRLADENAVQFNISHSENLALFAFTTKQAVGIDVERIRDNSDIRSVARQFFSVNELRSLSELTDNELISAFYNYWVRKEAVVKAIGNGLTLPLDSFEVSLVPNDPVRRVSSDGQRGSALIWKLHPLIPIDGYVGALAIEGNIERLNRWRWAEGDFCSQS